MPTRPYSIVRTADFLGLRDDLPIEGQDAQASILRNLYRKRRKLVRRKGQAFVAEAVEMTDPLTLADLELYLLSTTPADADGAAVSTWEDSSPHNRDFTQGGSFRPLMRRTGANISPNGTEMIEFDATNDGMDGDLGAGISTTNGYTIYLYVKLLVSDSVSRCLFTCGGIEIVNGTNSGFDLYPVSGQFGVQGGAVDANKRCFGVPVIGYQLLVVRFNPPTGTGTDKIQMWTDGVALTPNNSSITWDQDLNGAATLGNFFGLGSPSRACFGAVAVFSTAHDTNTMDAVSEYLTNYFEGS